MNIKKRHTIVTLLLTVAFLATSFLHPLSASAAAPSTKGYTEMKSSSDLVVKKAKNMLGTSYSRYDCSAFVQKVYRDCSIELPRGCSEYANEKYAKYGKKVARQDLKPGDLILYGSSTSKLSHIAIYLGNGLVIHSMNPKKGVCITYLDYTSYCEYRKTSGAYEYFCTSSFQFAVRVNGIADSKNHTIKSIAVDVPGTVTQKYGKKLDRSYNLIVFYRDSTFEYVPLDKVTINGYKSLIPGKQTLTVKYNGVTCKYVVNVK